MHLDCIARPQLSMLDEFLRDNRVGSLRRAECSEVKNDISIQKRVMGGNDSPDIEGVYRRFVLDTSKSCNPRYYSLELSQR